LSLPAGLIKSLYKFLLLIFKQMKKIFFLMLAFLIGSAASTNAQVRIGGTDDPNPSTVLDLNATNATNNGALGLALPRVNFSDLATKLHGTDTPPNGMLVYNTNTSLGAGIYYWEESSWVKIPDGSDSPSCTGAIVYGGAYNGPASNIYSLNLGGLFEPNWSASVFSIQGRDLCWALNDISEKKTWADAITACNDLTTDNRRWRLPNLKELSTLYEAQRLLNRSGTSFANLDVFGTGKSNGAHDLEVEGIYWSSTRADDNAWSYGLGLEGYRNRRPTDEINRVRCVRSF
jgi:hypothetical protein